MNFDYYLRFRVLLDNFRGQTLKEIPDENSDIIFKLYDGTDAVIKIHSFFFYFKESGDYNSVEFKIKEIIEKSENLDEDDLLYSAINDIITEEWPDLVKGCYLSVNIFEEQNCVEITFNVSFYSIAFDDSFFAKTLNCMYKDFITDEYRNKLKNEYKKFNKININPHRLKKSEKQRRHKIWNKRNIALNKLFKCRDFKNNKSYNYSIFLFNNIVRDNIDLLFTYNCYDYVFSAEFKGQTLEFTLNARRNSSCDNLNEIEQAFMEEEPYIKEDYMPYSVSSILYEFLDDYHFQANLEINDDEIKIKVKSSFDCILCSKNILEKTLRDKLLDLFISDEDYIMYDKLWEKEHFERYGCPPKNRRPIGKPDIKNFSNPNKFKMDKINRN